MHEVILRERDLLLKFYIGQGIITVENAVVQHVWMGTKKILEKKKNNKAKERNQETHLPTQLVWFFYGKQNGNVYFSW